MATRNVNVRVGANTTGLQRGMRRAGRVMRGFASQVGSVTKTVGGLSLALGAAAVGGVALLGRQALKDIDNYAKMAKNLDSTVDQVQRLDLASQLAGLNLEGTSKAALRLNRTLGEARMRGGRAAEAFAELGLSTEKLAGQTPVGIFEGVLEKLGQMTDFQKRATIGSDLFGREWQKLAPLMDKGGSAFRRARAEIEGLGFGITEKQASGVEKLNDNVTVLFERFQNFTRLVTAHLAPAFDGLIEKALAWSGGLIKDAGGAQELARVIATDIVNGINKVIARWQEFVRVLNATANPFEFIPGTARVVSDRLVSAAPVPGIASSLAGASSGIPARGSQRESEMVDILRRLLAVNERQAEQVGGFGVAVQ